MIKCKAVTCIFRHGKDDFSVWEVDFPTTDIERIKKGHRLEAPDVKSLLTNMPVCDDFPVYTICLLEQDSKGASLMIAPVSLEFVEEYNHHGISTRGSLTSILDELGEPCEQETEINIMWDDLKPETQQRLYRMLGDNGNYDVFPIATICAPELNQTMQ